IRGAAEVVASDFAAERQRLRGAKVQHLDGIARHDPDISRFQIVVQQYTTRGGNGLEPIRLFEKLTKLTGDGDRACPGQGPAMDDLRQVLAGDIFHRDVENVRGEA